MRTTEGLNASTSSIAASMRFSIPSPSPGFRTRRAGLMSAYAGDVTFANASAGMADDRRSIPTCPMS